MFLHGWFLLKVTIVVVLVFDLQKGRVVENSFINCKRKFFDREAIAHTLVIVFSL